MKTIHKKLIVVMMIMGVLGTIVACSSTKVSKDLEATSTIADAMQKFKIEKSGAQMWGETCNRCHLAPSPADYNDTDWETISLHMRVRANLTEAEITKIEEFLKSAN